MESNVENLLDHLTDRLDPVAASAIAKFLKDGGKITKIPEAVLATEPEILYYLAGCGVEVKYRVRDAAYRHHHKRYNLAGLVKLANGYRLAQHLAPFEVRPPTREVRKRRHQQ